MTMSKQCDGRRKEKSKSKSFNLEDKKPCSQDDNQDKTVTTKKRKPYSKTEETPGSVPVLKVRKRPPESELTEVMKSQKSKGQVEENTEKKRKKRKMKCYAAEEPPQDASASTGEKQRVEDEDAEVALSPEERRALERKMKKMRKQEQKRRLKAEGKNVEKPEATKPSAGQLALDYLTCWSEKRQDWKFQKTRQTWLLQHMFDREKVPDRSFSILLPYLEGLQGVARGTTVQKAEALVRELEGEGERPEEQEAQLRAYRAREVIQMLS